MMGEGGGASKEGQGKGIRVERIDRRDEGGKGGRMSEGRGEG